MNAFKTSFLFLTLFLAAAGNRAEAQWEWLNPVPEANEFFDAAAPGIGQIWFVGENGSIVYTSDTGLSWHISPNPLRGTPLVLLSIIFTDPQTALISANNGNILRSNDKGTTWEVLASPQKVVQRMKQAPDGSIWGFGSNGSIARTTDLGTSWESFTTNITTIVYDLAFPDANTVLAACGEGKLLKSTNTGQTWTESIPNVQQDLISMEFVNANVGFMLQRNKILLRTDNGGASWSDTAFAVNEMRQVRFASENVGWILTNSFGNVYKTTNGGMSWNIVTVDPTTTYTLQGVFTATENDVMMYGIGGGMFFSSDGGQIWTQLGGGVSRGSMNSVTGLSQDESWVFGDDAAFHTTDAGQTWSANMAPPGQSFRIGYALSSTRLIGGGEQGELYLSSNGGLNWNLIETLSGAGAIEEFDFVDQNYGWCAGPHGTIGYTTNGGADWLSRDPGVTDDFHAISAVSATVAWVAGSGGKIYSTTDGGQSWNPSTSGTQSNLRSIRFVDASNGWAGGEFMLLRTTNGGGNWTRVLTTGLDVVYDIEFTDDTTGFFLGSRSLLRTKNGGSSFYRTDYPASHLNDLDPLASGYAWLASGFGGILRYIPAPVIRVVPSAIDFGNVATNRVSDKTFEVQSVGEVPLDFANLAVSSQPSGYFIIKEEETPITLPPGASSIVTIRFAPQTIGFARGIAAAISNAAMGSGIVDLLGNGITPLPPGFSHLPDTLDFGKIRCNDINELWAHIENVSAKNILVDSAYFTGGDSTSFLVSQPPTAFFIPGKKDSIGVLFVARRPGPLSSTLVVVSNDAGEPQYKIHVKGEVINSILSPSRTTVNFGYVFIPQSPVESITITNAGDAPLNILLVEIRGTNAADFAITQQPVSPVAPGATTELKVAYTAAEPFGPREAYIYLESDDCLEPNEEIQLRARPTTLGVEDGGAVPAGAALSQNYPNPFSASLHGATALTMTLEAQADVAVQVYDALGRRMRTLARGVYHAGSHELTFGAAGLVPGTYFVELTATVRGTAVTKRITVVLTK